MVIRLKVKSSVKVTVARMKNILLTEYPPKFFHGAVECVIDINPSTEVTRTQISFQKLELFVDMPAVRFLRRAANEIRLCRPAAVFVLQAN